MMWRHGLCSKDKPFFLITYEIPMFIWNKGNTHHIPLENISNKMVSALTGNSSALAIGKQIISPPQLRNNKKAVVADYIKGAVQP